MSNGFVPASNFKCKDCGITLAQRAELVRVNPKGVKGIWQCRRCLNTVVDPEVLLLGDILSGKKVKIQ